MISLFILSAPSIELKSAFDVVPLLLKPKIAEEKSTVCGLWPTKPRGAPVLAFSKAGKEI